VRVMAHLHGGFVAADSDGNPAVTLDGFGPGETQEVFYTNQQPRCRPRCCGSMTTGLALERLRRSGRRLHPAGTSMTRALSRTRPAECACVSATSIALTSLRSRRSPVSAGIAVHRRWARRGRVDVECRISTAGLRRDRMPRATSGCGGRRLCGLRYVFFRTLARPQR
jgi:hypothetical protein